MSVCVCRCVSVYVGRGWALEETGEAVDFEKVVIGGDWRVGGWGLCEARLSQTGRTRLKEAGWVRLGQTGSQRQVRNGPKRHGKGCIPAVISSLPQPPKAFTSLPFLPYSPPFFPFLPQPPSSSLQPPPAPLAFPSLYQPPA